MKKYDAKLEMAILVALTYAYNHRLNPAESRHHWMQRVGYLLAATLYIR